MASPSTCAGGALMAALRPIYSSFPLPPSAVSGYKMAASVVPGHKMIGPLYQPGAAAEGAPSRNLRPIFDFKKVSWTRVQGRRDRAQQPAQGETHHRETNSFQRGASSWPCASHQPSSMAKA